MKINMNRDLKLRLLTAISKGTIEFTDFPELNPELDYSVLSDAELNQLYLLLKKATIEKN